MSSRHTVQELIESLCRQAGEILLEDFGKPKLRGGSEGVSRVSETELRLMYLVAAFAKQHFPDDRVFGHDDTSDFSGRVWVCDPIDGSYLYVRNLPLFTFSVALLEDGKPVAAAVYEPVGDRLYYAEKGNGASLNGVPLRVPPLVSFQKQLVMLTGQHDGHVDLPGLYTDLREQGAKPMITYSVVQHAVRVTTGEVCATVSNEPFLQDVTAVRLIVEEAGGMVLGLDGKEHSFSRQKVLGFMVAPRAIMPALAKMISDRTA